VTRAVTSSTPSSTSACWPGQVRSSSWDRVEKPVASTSFSGVEKVWTQERTQCWLVRTSPFGDTRLAEQPPARRTAPP
jgi:hypothetical protein